MNTKGMKYNITPEGRKVRQATAQKNLEGYRKKNPAGGNLKHGGESRTIRKRFDDMRTNQGKTLAAVLKELMEHFGGPKNITAPMQLLIDAGIRPKLITLMCINDYINKQAELINGSGELLSCLGKNYIGFSNALRLDLSALTEMAKAQNKGRSDVPRIEDFV